MDLENKAYFIRIFLKFLTYGSGLLKNGGMDGKELLESDVVGAVVGDN